MMIAIENNIWIRRVDDFCPHNQALGYGGWFESEHAFFVLLGQKVFMLRENIHCMLAFLFSIKIMIIGIIVVIFVVFYF